MKKKALLIWIPLVALLGNGAGYLVVSNVRNRSKEPISSATQVQAASTAEDRSDDRVKQESARARRAAGLAALEAGDYEKALINFTEARALVGEQARVDELLRVTDDLRARARSTATTAPLPAIVAAPPATIAAPAARWIVPTRAPVRPAAPSRPATPEPVPTEPRSAVVASNTGLLLVTTTPRGLLVQIDGAPIDLTPMRTALKPGTHRVALLDGDRRLYETSVDVTEGSTTTVLRDLSTEMSGESLRPAVVGGVKEEPSRPAPAPATFDTIAAPQAAKPPAASDTGGLDISSPGLYGVVWVNDRPYGFPPVTLRDLPPGPAKIAVRVNGVEKRVTTVVVQPGLSTPVKIR